MNSNNLESSSSGNKERLWVISELYYPEMTSTGYYLTKIAEGLSGDYDVKVVCGQPNYSARGTTAPKHEFLAGVEIFRVFGTRLNKNVIPFRILNMFTLGFSVFLRCFRGFERNDKVLVVTTPPLMPFLTGLAAFLKRSTHILLIHDSYPEILYAAGKMQENSYAARILEYFSNFSLRAADSLIVVGRDMKESVSRKRDKAGDCAVIPNWAELETVSPAPRESNPLLTELDLMEKFVFLYAGNMGYPNDIETFVAAAETLQQECEKAHFVFLGDGVKKPFLLNAVKVKQLKNITVLDSRPRSDQQDFLNACDVGIVSLVSKMKGVSMPSRTYNILAAGKPILAMCDADSEISLVVEEENAGWRVDPGDTAGLITLVKSIVYGESGISVLSTNARNAALRKYSLEEAVKKYRKALIKIPLERNR